MIIAGIDPGSNVTGYSFIKINERDQNRPQVLEYGVIRSRPKESLPQKLDRIHQTLTHLFSQYQPSHMALESAFVAKFPQAALILGHTRGAIMVAAMALQIEIFEYEPRLIKKASTGSGAASKDQVAEMVQKHYQLKSIPTPSDAADALAIAYCHLLHARLI